MGHGRGSGVEVGDGVSEEPLLTETPADKLWLL